MNFEDMQYRVFSVLRDDQRRFVTDEDVEEWLNEAQELIAQRIEYPMKEATVAFANGKIALPSDFIRLETMHVGDTKVYFTDNVEFDKYKDSAQWPYRSLGRLFNDSVEMLPSPTDGELATIRYIRKPLPMSSSQTTCELPAEYHYNMIDFARAHGKYKMEELESGDRYMSSFEKGLPLPSTSASRRFPGPLNARYAPGPFDYMGGHRG